MSHCSSENQSSDHTRSKLVTAILSFAWTSNSIRIRQNHALTWKNNLVILFWVLCMCWDHSHVFICLLPWREDIEISQRPGLSGLLQCFKMPSTWFGDSVSVRRWACKLQKRCLTHAATRNVHWIGLPGTSSCQASTSAHAWLSGGRFALPREGLFLVHGQPFFTLCGCTLP